MEKNCITGGDSKMTNEKIARSGQVSVDERGPDPIMRPMARRTNEVKARERLDSARRKRRVISDALKAAQIPGERRDLLKRHEELIMDEVGRWREWWGEREKKRKRRR